MKFSLKGILLNTASILALAFAMPARADVMFYWQPLGGAIEQTPTIVISDEAYAAGSLTFDYARGYCSVYSSFPPGTQCGPNTPIKTFRYAGGSTITIANDIARYPSSGGFQHNFVDATFGLNIVNGYLVGSYAIVDGSMDFAIYTSSNASGIWSTYAYNAGTSACGAGRGIGIGVNAVGGVNPPCSFAQGRYVLANAQGSVPLPGTLLLALGGLIAFRSVIRKQTQR